MAIDWITASKEDLRGLYRVAEKICALREITWDRFFDLAYEGSGHRQAAADQHNFSQARLGRNKAAQIHLWITETHLDVGQRLEPELFAATGTRWQQALDTFGVYGQLTLVRLERGFGLNTSPDRNPIKDPKLRFLEPFHLVLEARIAGTAMAFEEYQRKWYPLSLTQSDMEPTLRVEPGGQPLPWNTDLQAPERLHEDVDAGRHGYAVIVGPADLIDTFANRRAAGIAVRSMVLEELAKAIKTLPSDRFELHRLNLFFEALAVDAADP